MTRALLERELAPMRAHGLCRVVVSGPEAFNSAMRELCVAIGHSPGMVTVLSA